MRRLLHILAGVLALVLLGLITLPWWLGLAARPVAHHFGAGFGRYERVGYARFRLHDAVYQHGPVTITAAEVECTTPLLYLSAAARNVTATGWKVEINPTAGETDPAAKSKIDGVPALHDLLDQVAAGLDRWLTTASLGPGQVHWPEQTLALAQTDWRDRTLTVHGLAWRKESGDAVINWPEQGPVFVNLKAASGDWQAKLNWVGSRVNGLASVWSQPLPVQAEFLPGRWLPESAELKAENWNVPAARVQLGAQYALIHGDARLAWARDHFSLSANLQTTARPDAKSVPTLEGRIEVTGDQQALTLTALHVDAPFATAELSEPVTLDYASGLRASSARLTLKADLSRQTWFEARGIVRGTVGVSASSAQAFDLNCTDLKMSAVAFLRGSVRGTLQWPRLTVSALELQPDADNKLTVHGSIDVLTHDVSGGVAEASLSSPWFEQWLPAGTHWNKAELAADFSGPIAALNHSGKLSVDQIASAVLHPTDVHATWQGSGATLQKFTLHAAAGESTLEIAGALTAHQLEFQSLVFAGPDRAPWTLVSPATWQWSPAIRVEGFRLERPDGHLVLAVSAAGVGQLDMANFEVNALRNWIVFPGPDWTVKTLLIDGKLVENVVSFTAKLNGQLFVAPHVAEINLLAHGGVDGVKLDDLSTTMEGKVVTQATGHFPLSWQPGKTPRLRVDWQAPFALDAQTAPDSPLWATLATVTGLALEQPVAKIHLGGTMEQPTGDLSLTATRIAVTKGEFKERWPEITELVVAARADSQGLNVDTLSGKVDGQQINAQGKLPAGRSDWQELRTGPLAFIWTHGEGHVEIPDADLALLARHAPDMIAERGRLSAKVELASGGSLSGELHLHDAALRPISGLGAVQEINADLALDNRQLEVKSWSAKLGGEPVELQGTVELSADNAPKLALTLQGKNLPLVRRTGLILRSDIDLRASTDSSGKTEISGAVTLRNSVVLADLATLRPSGPTTASRQPPYFSIPREPFRDWTLAVDLLGPRAIRIRTPVFTGVASLRFRIAGTLGEPRAVGELAIDEGRVFFPFAAFTVQSGTIRLSEADPYHPQISVNAQSRYHNYLLRMDVSGPVDSPTVLLTSSPALESAQLLLMVTTGQSPETDVASASEGQRLARLGTFLGQGLILGNSSKENRIELTSGSGVSRQGRETYEFTYRLDDRWSLVGEYDEFDEYNAGVKWRAYVQEGDKYEKK